MGCHLLILVLIPTISKQNRKRRKALQGGRLPLPAQLLSRPRQVRLYPLLVLELISSALFLASHRKPLTFSSRQHHLSSAPHVNLLIKYLSDTFQTEAEPSQYFSQPSHVSNYVSPYTKRGLSLTSPFTENIIKYILTSFRAQTIHKHYIANSADSIISAYARD